MKLTDKSCKAAKDVYNKNSQTENVKQNDTKNFKSSAQVESSVANYYMSPDISNFCRLSISSFKIISEILSNSS